MIYVTGDTHGDYDIEKIKNFLNLPIGRLMTKDDYLIVLGDFGALFYGEPAPGTEWYYKLEANGLLDDDKKTLQFWKDCPWTTLFIDGNHENHDLLDAYPVKEWHGGKVHYLADNVIHLMRGQVFEIEGSTFFTMGGAESTDKWHRTEGESWWAREMPSNEEYNEAIENLEKYNFKVDYILTHCAPEAYVSAFMRYVYDRKRNQLSNFFCHLLIDFHIDFEGWYFGHYHCDEDHDKFHLMYHNIRRLHTRGEKKEQELK